MNSDSEKTNISNHIWKYFEIHASQRLTVFNFFSAFSGLIAAGIGAVAPASKDYSAVGVALGAMLIVISFIFWKLDQRAAFLIKHAEEALKRLEADTQAEFGLFSSEPTRHGEARAARSWITKPWSFGESFRGLFVLMAGAGAGAVIFFSARLLKDLL